MSLGALLAVHQSAQDAGAGTANAIYQAIGVRMDRLPMSPGAILATLQRKQTHP